MGDFNALQKEGKIEELALTPLPPESYRGNYNGTEPLFLRTPEWRSCSLNNRTVKQQHDCVLCSETCSLLASWLQRRALQHTQRVWLSVWALPAAVLLC